MKKAAIMTWYHYQNFGTALQVTALSHVLHELGYSVNVIQYIPPDGRFITKSNSNSLICLLGFYLKRVPTFTKRILKKFSGVPTCDNFVDKKRNELFQKFIDEHLVLTAKCQTYSELFALKSNFDVFVCGSDQIWSPLCFDTKYFLDFIPKLKKIAYAPSIGVTQIKDKYIRNCMKKLIDDFRFLSVREEQGKKLIKEICNKDAVVALDPTLLLKKEWNNYLNDDYAQKQGKYLLCYFLGENQATWNHVWKIADKLGLQIKIVPVFQKDVEKPGQILTGVGPAEFLGLIKHAAFVCTDSFHGVAFSINFHKEFCVYERFSNNSSDSQNSRIYNILNITGLKTRLIKDKNKINVDLSDIDFLEVDKKLEQYRNESIQFLKKSLTEISKFNILSQKKEITNTCCGCGNCAIICPNKAIEIKKNKNGFIEAEIQKEKCTNCGLCKKVCPYNGQRSSMIDAAKHKLYMAKSKNSEVLQKSSSGGIGHELASSFCKQGYDVAGCMYDYEEEEARHVLINKYNIEGLGIFQGSKYIQSNTFTAFKIAVEKSEKAIIFATPCQIAGLDRLLRLKNKRNNFILVDLICHGVPSQNLWEKYLLYIKNKVNLTNYEVEFRTKEKSWHSKYMQFVDINSKSSYCTSERENLFYSFFLLRNCFMKSCYECIYRENSAADIRIGDYWGERFKKDTTGVSMIIALTTAGETALHQLQIENKIEMCQYPCDEYWKVQYPYNPLKPVFYDELMDDLQSSERSLKEIEKEYCREFFIKRKIGKIKNKLLFFYRMIKKITNYKMKFGD